MKIAKIILISVVAVLVTGCAKTINNKMQQGGVTSAELYRSARSGHGESVARALDVRRVKHMIRSDARHEPYTRTSMNETEQLFKLLPNPKISIHVYPHISTRDNAPVPGYTTAVSLYRADEYALPAELVAQGLEVDVKDANKEEDSAEEVTTQEPAANPSEGYLDNSLEVKLIKEMNGTGDRS